MKKVLLLMMAVAMCGFAASAETKYEINVGGIEVTSSNQNNVYGGDITVTQGCSSGYVKYEPNNNTLILRNISIKRTKSGDYAVHNRNCADLTIRLEGKCYLESEKAVGMKLQKHTLINMAEDGYSEVCGKSNSSSGTAAIDISNNSVSISGYGTLVLKGGSQSTPTITGTGSLSFIHNDLNIYNNYGNALQSMLLLFYTGCNVYISGYYAIENCRVVYGYVEGSQSLEILKPYLGYFSNPGGYGTILDSNGNQAQSVRISDHYVAIINSTYFPDSNFRNYLLNSGFSKGYIDSDDVANCTGFYYMTNKGISNLQGIEYFTNLTYLDCSNNNLSSLNLSALTKLNTLYCSYNNISSLTLPNSLKSLYCGNNKLNSLSIPSSLEVLDCGNNMLTTLGILPYTITRVYCNNNRFTSLSITGKSYLTYLDCSNNPYLTNLECRNNALTSLYVSGCTSLKTLYCQLNKLTSLSLGGLNALTTVQLNYNQIKIANMLNMINSLRTIPAGSLGNLYVLVDNDNNEGNEINTELVRIARNKRWIPWKFSGSNWVEIPANIPGDVNGDGSVNSADITALYDYLLNNDSSGIVNGDVDGDGHITSGDITAVYDILLGS